MKIDENILLYGAAANVFFTALFRVFWYMIALQEAKARSIYSQETSFFQTPLLWSAIWEISLNLIHPNPYLSNISFEVYNSSKDIYLPYQLNDILCLIGVIVKSYYIMKQFYVSLEYNSNKMQRLFALYGADELGFMFSFKIFLIRKPNTFIAVSMIVSLIFFSFIIKVSERPLQDITPVPLLKDWDDLVWFCIITMTTVGYGDRVPFTLPARLATFFMILWGSIWTSLFISTLNSVFQLDSNALKALNLYHRTQSKNVMHQKAALVIQDLMKLNLKLLKDFSSVKKVHGSRLMKTDDADNIQKQIMLNLKHVKKLKKEMEFYKLETLYFEEDMMGKYDLLRDLEKQIVSKEIRAEEEYKYLFLESYFTSIMRLDPDFGKPKAMVTKIIYRDPPPQAIQPPPLPHKCEKCDERDHAKPDIKLIVPKIEPPKPAPVKLQLSVLPVKNWVWKSPKKPEPVVAPPPIVTPVPPPQPPVVAAPVVPEPKPVVAVEPAVQQSSAPPINVTIENSSLVISQNSLDS